MALTRCQAPRVELLDALCVVELLLVALLDYTAKSLLQVISHGLSASFKVQF